MTDLIQTNITTSDGAVTCLPPVIRSVVAQAAQAGGLKKLMDEQFVATISCYDFGHMVDWPLNPRFGFTRLRFCIPAVGAKLYELQQYTRDLENGFTIEQETFQRLRESMMTYVRRNPNGLDRMMDQFNSKLVRRLGEGMIENMDPQDRRGLKKIFNFDLGGWYHMSEDMKCIIEECELTERDVAPDAFTSLNAALRRLANIAFLASFHYSIMERYSYQYHFERMLRKCFELVKQPISPHAATILFAGAQIDPAKRKLILQKCGSVKLGPDQMQEAEDMLMVDMRITEVERFMQIVAAIPYDVVMKERILLIEYLIGELITDVMAKKLVIQKLRGIGLPLYCGLDGAYLLDESHSLLALPSTPIESNPVV
jgi:hypothetical protein